MGLDWNPGNKAKPGFEAEFADVFRTIQTTDPGETRNALLDRYHEISITAFETLQAPVVGRDPDADAWARQLLARNGRDEPEDQFLARLAGFAVLPLVPPCDGLPRYTNGSPGGYVEQYSFRAHFLHDCEEELGDDLLADAYESELPDDLLNYGHELLTRAEHLARRHGLDPRNLVVPDTFPTIDEIAAGNHTPAPLSVEHKVNVLHSAGRWCIFWGERGHLLDAYW
jgi:hypothetical protein